MTKDSAQGRRDVAAQPTQPARHTAGASKMASVAPSIAQQPTKIGAAPAFGRAMRYYVDPATVCGPFSAAGIGRDVDGKEWGDVS